MRNKTITLLLVCLGLVCAVNAQEGEQDESPVKALILAKNDADGNIIENPEVFTVKDVPIFCYVDLKVEKSSLIMVKFVAVKAKGIRPNTVIISAKYQTKKGEIGAAFDGKPKGQWVPGDYRVDAYVDGKLVEKREFTILP
jgi:hypothetical protein